MSASAPYCVLVLVACDSWALSQQMALDFDMVPEVLGDFPRLLSVTGIADLGKRRRAAAFGVDFACKTAQKLPAGLRAQGKGKAGLAFGSGMLRAGLVCDMPCHVTDER